MKSALQILFTISLLCYCLTGTPQNILRIYDQSRDSLEKIGLLSFIITSEKANQRGSENVILNKSTSSSDLPSYIIKSNGQEIIFDGKFGFIVNHVDKTVRQVNEKMIKKQPSYEQSFIAFFIGYNDFSSKLDKS